MYGLSTLFLVTLLRDKIRKRQVIHNHMTQKSITMEILHAYYVTCDKMQCHTLVVFLSVLRHFSVSVMDV